MRRNQSLRKLVGVILVAFSILSVVSPASAELSQDQVSALNPKWTKYKECPKDGPCYLLDTRFVSARITDPSEAG